MRKLALLLVLVTTMLSGCAGWVVFGHTIEEKHPAPAAQSTPPPVPVASRLTKVTVAFTPEVKEKVSADPRFKDGSLLAAIESELRNRKMLNDADATDATAGRTVEVLIDDFATRASSNAVVFGYVLGTGSLSGNVDVRDAAGNEVQTFRIKADSRLATPASDEQAQSLQPLYHRFANLTVDDLAGTSHQPASDETATNNEVPR